MNLYQGELAPDRAFGAAGKALKAALVLGALLPIVLAGAAIARAVRYDRQADQARRQQVETYRQLCPNTPVPSMIRARLQSDLQRFGGISGSDQQLPRMADALRTLRQVVAALPTDRRWQLTDLRISPEGIHLEGRTLQFSDAEVIGQSLSASGLRMDSPRSEKLVGDQGVAFTLTGGLADNAEPSDLPSSAQQPTTAPDAVTEESSQEGQATK